VVIAGQGTSTSPAPTNERGRFRRAGLRPVCISGLATYVPPRLLTNDDLERMVDTNHEWILQRTGISERHIVDPGVATSDLAREAATRAIAQAGITPADVGVIIVGTTTPDMMFPSTACLLQHKIGATNAWGFDLGAACSGFTYALTTAAQLVASGAHDHALAVGADVMSSIIDYTDRTTCVLFGDGAGAVVVSQASDRDLSIVDFECEVDGSGGPSLCMPAGGSLRPASHETVNERLHYVKQDGAAVFRFAVRKTEEICRRLLERNGLTGGDLDLFVSHQANKRIILSAAERLGLDEQKVVINIGAYGNTTAATIPLALNDAVADGRLKKGSLVLLTSVGAGFTVGSVLLRGAICRRGGSRTAPTCLPPSVLACLRRPAVFARSVPPCRPGWRCCDAGARSSTASSRFPVSASGSAGIRSSGCCPVSATWSRRCTPSRSSSPACSSASHESCSCGCC